MTLEERITQRRAIDAQAVIATGITWQIQVDTNTFTSTDGVLIRTEQTATLKMVEVEGWQPPQTPSAPDPKQAFFVKTPDSENAV